MVRGRTTWLGASAAAMMLPAAAMGQTPAAPAQASTSSADPLPPSSTLPAPPPATAGAPTDPADAASGGIADIVVTAQKRDTTLQRTAAAVQVIGAPPWSTAG